MFTTAIEIASKFTRPIHSIIRRYGNNIIEPGCSTFIILNNEGYILTCKHVVEGQIALAEQTNSKYNQFKVKLSQLPKNGKLRQNTANLEREFGYEKGGMVAIQIKNNLLNVVDMSEFIQWLVHPQYDLALVKFNGFNQIQCEQYPVFAKDSSQLKQGKSLCRLGYPYPEFNNFRYNEQTDDIEWTSEGNPNTPQFPIDGILTRHLADNSRIVGVELSTPGLRGQSGGPLFDTNGVVYGLQSATKTLPLGFDQIDREIIVNGKKKKINDYSFIHLGHCIHIDIIKEFLDQHGVRYAVEP